ncbi:hypothetical protein OHA70_00555 [Kribbella sp. NBC_00382]|uniref:hypothetical protein n=1 Tax=Kribbella sp. NBC_00382 TaxID=2975967 RepID=UPI002E1EDCE3
MTTRRAYVAAALLLPLLLTGCKNTSPTAVPPPPTPSSTPSPTPPKLLDIKPPNTPEQLQAALPTAYGKVKFSLSSALVSDWTPRDDPFEGHRVEPESCRAELWTGGRTPKTFAKFPYLPYADAFPTSKTNGLHAGLVSVPAPFGDKYLDAYPLAAPQCVKILIDGRDQASIVERPVPGLGTRSRFYLRTYTKDGKVHREGQISFITPTYYATVANYATSYDEATLIAFAHHVQALADSKLKR